ncbi:cadherin-like domain-containing protein [Pseudomonas stutzeri]|nr:cadherin-like domain-containing protein [Stutzerimonas stutzeri]
MSSVAVAATEDTPVTFSAADLLGNDSDVDGDSLSIASVTSGTGGSAVLNADGTVTFTPDGQGRGVGQAAVGDGVVHRVGAVEVRRRRVGVAAVGGDHDAAALGGDEGPRHHRQTSGVKVTVPSAFSTAVPPVPLVTLAMLRLSPSTSLSLPSRSAALKVTGVSSVAAS